MAKEILTTKRPRAIAKEKDGIVLYWIEEFGKGGLHLKGLARLLDYNPGSLAKFIQGVEQIVTLEAETVTGGGLQGVELYLGADIAKILKAVSKSKINEAVRDRADDIRDNLVAAGFELAVMLELAPQQLKAQVDKHVSDLDKHLEIERLRHSTQQLHGSMLTLHGQAWLALQGVGTAERETIVTEVVEPATGHSTKILTAEQLKRTVKERTGQNIKSMKQFTDAIRSCGRDDLLIPVTRHTTNEYVMPDKLDEAISVVYGYGRQFLVGE